MKLFNFIPIAKEGLTYILIAGFITGAIIYFSGINTVSFFLILITTFIISFFRNPDRITPINNDLIISPADGKVIFIGEVNDDRILKKRVRMISIFMSVFNVHVNRMPISGKIKNIVYNKGKFLHAAAHKSSLDNEQNATVVQREDGQEILFIQIAGFIARRIVSYLKINETYSVGERMGIIKFGSRVDIYLPLSAEINVSVNDKTRGGETILAKIPLRS